MFLVVIPRRLTKADTHTMKTNQEGVRGSLGLGSPWEILSDEYDNPDRVRRVMLTCSDTSSLACPQCKEVCPFYDLRTARSWRHLDTCTYRTELIARIPRVKCPAHGVRTVEVPWASPSSRFTYGFEEMVIGWLREASVSAVSRQLGVGWKAVSRIMEHAVARGLDRRQTEIIPHICVDETSFRKRHKYVTIVSNAKSGQVLYVGIGRTKDVLKHWYQRLSSEQLAGIESVSMDMWPAYVSSTFACVPDAEKKIAFDRFHVAKYLGEAVDKVRRQEHKALRAEGDTTLTGSKYDWLTNRENMSKKQKKRFQSLKNSSLKTARAWAIKEMARNLWHYVHPTWARKGWEKWLSWAMRCRLEPVKEAAKTIKKHLWGIINAIILKVSNGPAESINSRIKTVKVRSRGFRNNERFATAIYFHLGGLDLSPRMQ